MNCPENIMNKGVFPNSIAEHDMIACSRKITFAIIQKQNFEIIQIILQKN